MDQIRNFGDARTLSYCAFCGGSTGTKDHCPSKVFLDEPLPANLPVVPACRECNNGFSADEEYVACLIACVIVGSTVPASIDREKIRRILAKKPALQARIEQSKTVNGDQAIFEPDFKRVQSVVIKLAKGHALYELHESCSHEPSLFSVMPLLLMSDDQRIEFEVPVRSAVWPEVGSRAMVRLVEETDVTPHGWVVAQEGRYRYNASLQEGIDIRIVINEYLACHVIWD